MGSHIYVISNFADRISNYTKHIERDSAGGTNANVYGVSTSQNFIHPSVCFYSSRCMFLLYSQ